MMLDGDLERDWHEAEARRSTRIAVVWRDYQIEAGIIKRKGERYTGREYFPIAKPGLVSGIAKLQPGDERAVLTFVRRWGLLGYATPRSFPRSDPLIWIWAHASGIRAVLKLRRLLQQGDDEQLSEYLDSCRVTDRMLDAQERLTSLLRPGQASKALEHVDQLFRIQSSDEWLAPCPMLIYGIGDQIACTGWPERGNIRQAARRIMADIINPNMVGVYRELWLTEDSSGLEIRRVWDSPLSVAYWHLGELVAGGRVEECEHCHNLFVQRRRDQRFCPPPPFTSESSCASAFRQRKRRQKGD